MTPPIKNIIFDFGNVLLEWNPEKVIAERFPSATADHIRAAAEKIHHHWHDLDAGNLTVEEAINVFAMAAGITPALMADMYYALRSSLDVKTDSLALARTLQAEGFTLFGLSNMCEDFWSWLTNQYTFWSIFTDIVISAKVRIIKPDPKIYHYALERFDIAPEETIFIDDSPANITSANTVGIKGILFTSAQAAETEIRKLLVSSSSGATEPMA